MHPKILKLDISGSPVAWINWESAATLYARGCVKWEAGKHHFDVYGGFRADGSRSSLRLNSIIAVNEHHNVRRRKPALTNAALFARDGHTCLYCGERKPVSQLSRDHIVPLGQSGQDTWQNAATCCLRCNNRKGCRTPEQSSMKLLAVPYAPDPSRLLLLTMSGRHVLGDQQEWLEACATPLTLVN